MSVKTRITEVDGLRGLAALSVVLAHIFFTFPGAFAPRAWMEISTWLDPMTYFKLPPLRGMVSGQSAVIMFFVLSGFVLALPFVGRRPPPYAGYVIKRICRIYLPFAAAVVFGAAMYSLSISRPVQGLSDWFNLDSWTSPISLDLVFRHLLMTGIPEDMQLNNVMWSLVHEMRISLIFPVMMIAFRLGAIPGLIFFVLLFAAATGMRTMINLSPLAISLTDTLRYSAIFALGIAVALEKEKLKALVANGRPRLVFLAVVVSFLLLGLPPRPLLDLVYGAAAASLIVLAMGAPRLKAALRWAPVSWLGRVSYSLYLFHLPILLIAFEYSDDYLAPVATAALVLVLSLLAAEIAYRLVEKPAIVLGRKMASRLGDGAVSEPPKTAPFPSSSSTN